MKRETVLSILLVSTAALASTAMAAGNGPGGGGPGGGGAGGGAMDRMQQLDRDRTFDRDRMQDRDRMVMQDQDRVRDRLQIHDPAHMRNEDIYGNALMNDAERRQYRQQLGNAGTDQARMEYQLQHEQKMQQRALQQGVDLVPPGQGPIYGGQLMSVQERNEFREQLRLATTQEEHDALIAQHRERINERARALNLPVENVE